MAHGTEDSMTHPVQRAGSSMKNSPVRSVMPVQSPKQHTMLTRIGSLYLEKSSRPNWMPSRATAI